jgi:hypothetical protein
MDENKKMFLIAMENYSAMSCVMLEAGREQHFTS